MSSHPPQQLRASSLFSYSSPQEGTGAVSQGVFDALLGGAPTKPPDWQKPSSAPPQGNVGDVYGLLQPLISSTGSTAQPNTRSALEKLRDIAQQRNVLQKRLNSLVAQEASLREGIPTAAEEPPTTLPVAPPSSFVVASQSPPVLPGGSLALSITPLPQQTSQNARLGFFEGRLLLEITEVRGRIVEVAQDQGGCRFLQKKFEEGIPEDCEAILEEVCVGSVAASLMTDPFGNYLLQKVFEYGTDDQVTRVMRCVLADMATISFSMHGTRSVQKLIECSQTPQRMQILIAALRPHVIPLIKDLNGNHVIQKCLQRHADEDKQFIYDSVQARLMEVATNRQGCCVLQRCIDYAGPEQRETLLSEILSHTLQLVQDPFANYVVQYIVELNQSVLNARVIRQLLHNIVPLSCNKYSSNVVEKCIKSCPEDIRQLMIDELTDAQYLSQLLQDGFANYVLQTAIEVATQQQYQQISDAVRPFLHLVRNSPYGKRIESKLNRRARGVGQTPTSPDKTEDRGGVEEIETEHSHNPYNSQPFIAQKGSRLAQGSRRGNDRAQRKPNKNNGTWGSSAAQKPNANPLTYVSPQQVEFPMQPPMVHGMTGGPQGFVPSPHYDVRGAWPSSSILPFDQGRPPPMPMFAPQAVPGQGVRPLPPGPLDVPFPQAMAQGPGGSTLQQQNRYHMYPPVPQFGQRPAGPPMGTGRLPLGLAAPSPSYMPGGGFGFVAK